MADKRNSPKPVHIGERIKSCRTLAGLSLRELAQQVEVSAQALSKYERNEDIPSSGVLIRISKALNVPIEYLLRPPTVRFSTPAYRRHRSKMTKKAERRLLAQVQDWLERYLTVEQLVGRQTVFAPPDIPRKINHEHAVEDVAIALRHAWQLGLDPIHSLTEILEERGIKVAFLDGVDSYDALALVANETIPVIVVKRGVPGDRQRFSLAHELAHLLIETPEDWTHQQVERIANRFAGAFLVPEPVVRAELGFRRYHISENELRLLKHKYGLSMQAWVYRARDVGVISHARAQNYFQEFRMKGWHRTEPGEPYPPEKSTRLERLIQQALHEDIINPARATELLCEALKGDIYQHHEKTATPR